LRFRIALRVVGSDHVFLFFALGGFGALIGLLVGSRVASRRFLVAIVVAFAVCVVVGTAGKLWPAEHEEAGGWLVAILASFQLVAFVVALGIAAAIRAYRRRARG
jgi:hypothetical protein